MLTHGQQQGKQQAPLVAQLQAVNGEALLQRVQALEEEELLQGKFSAGIGNLEGRADIPPIQRQANNTGLPDNLKSGIENLSGYSMDDVKVPYNSDQPAQINAQPIQRYTIVRTADQAVNYWRETHNDLRVSDDGQMAVRHINGVPSDSNEYQDFYATRPIIRQSGDALRAIDSAFSIAADNQTLIGSRPNSRIARWRGQHNTLHRAKITNNDLADNGKGGYTFNACSANMVNFIGVLRKMPGPQNALDHRRNIILKIEGAFDRDRQQIDVGEDTRLSLLEARRIMTGENTSTRAKDAYNNMSGSMRKWLSWRYGLDEYAVPDVGESWGILRGGGNRDMNFLHFAPVIARSGEDRVTLENDTSQEANYEATPMGRINPNWYMRMFGPVKKHWFKANEDQTFWGEAKEHESDDYGPRPLVGRLGSVARV